MYISIFDIAAKTPKSKVANNREELFEEMTKPLSIHSLALKRAWILWKRNHLFYGNWSECLKYAWSIVINEY